MKKTHAANYCDFGKTGWRSRCRVFRYERLDVNDPRMGVTMIRPWEMRLVSCTYCRQLLHQDRRTINVQLGFKRDANKGGE